MAYIHEVKEVYCCEKAFNPPWIPYYTYDGKTGKLENWNNKIQFTHCPFCGTPFQAMGE